MYHITSKSHNYQYVHVNIQQNVSTKSVDTFTLYAYTDKRFQVAHKSLLLLSLNRSLANIVNKLYV
jgi:hypothetical protein